jgi:hypothetical protein
VVRVADRSGAPVSGIRVTFEPKAGLVQRLATTGADGTATAVWSDLTLLRAPTEVVVRVDHPTVASTLTVPIAPAPPPGSGYTLAALDRRWPWWLPLHFIERPPGWLADPLVWYADRQLRSPLVVRVVNADEAACPGVVVRFRPAGDATVGPDSAFGVWKEPKHGSPYCAAEARMKLGKDVGVHLARAQLASDPKQQVTLRTKARALPRITAGLVAVNDRRYDLRKDDSQPIKITRRWSFDSVIGGRTTTVTVDTVLDANTGRPNSVRSDLWSFTPTLGIDWAPFRPMTRVRISVSTALEGARDNWYAGVSILQLLQDFHREAIGIDFQGVVPFQRRNVVTNPAACQSLRTTDACATERHSLEAVGYGVMVTLDGVQLLTQLATQFGIKGL